MVRNLILDDPTVKLLHEHGKAYWREFDRYPSNAELEAWIAEKARQVREVSPEEAAAREKNREERRARDALELAREKARTTLLLRRLSIRSERPEGYEPPRTRLELIDRIEKGEAFFEDMKLAGETKNELFIVDLEACNISGSSFTDFLFGDGASFDRANARRVKFERCHFHGGCRCEAVDFTRSTFSPAHFDAEVPISDTSFEEATFSPSSQIRFDRNRVLHANIKDVRSEWVNLMAAFSGVQQFLNIVFCLGYFLVLLMKVYFFGALADFQTIMQSTAGASFLAEEGVPVWKAVFGGLTPTYFSLAVAALILIYQTGRYRLTSRIAPMIEDQRTDGRTPAASDYEQLTVSYQLVKSLGWLALVVFGLDLGGALLGTVYPLDWKSVPTP